ncbi:MAG TPA: hypothetical protein VN969_14960 [Streptosporangiaceae bacterium]|nr:hypothetical protein [Streptosporangiaceae bacterium]
MASNTRRSTSARASVTSASATSAMAVPVAGSVTVKRAPVAAGRQVPAMYRSVGPE